MLSVSVLSFPSPSPSAGSHSFIAFVLTSIHSFVLISESSGKMSLFLIAIVHSLLFQFAYSQSCAPENNVKLTFYGYPDGQSDTTSFGCSGTSPTGQGNNGGTAGGTLSPSSLVPQSRRHTDEWPGSGTYSDPETFATAMDNTDFKECEIVYIPYLKKYFRYNDHCQQCSKQAH